MSLEEIFAIYEKDNQTGVKLLEEYLKNNMLNTKVVYTLFAYYINNKSYVKAAHYLDLLRQTNINMYDYYTYLILMYDLLDLDIDLSNIKVTDLLIPKSDKKYDDGKGNNEVRKEIFNGSYFSAKKANNKVFHKKGKMTLEESIITNLINANVKKAVDIIVKYIEEGNYDYAYNLVFDMNNIPDEETLIDGLTTLMLQSDGMPLTREKLEELKKVKKIDDRIASSIIKQAELEDNVNKTVYYDNKTSYFYDFIEKMDRFYDNELAMQGLIHDYLEAYSKSEYYNFIMKVYEYLSKDVFFDYIYTILYGVDRSYLITKYEETNDEVYAELIALAPIKEREDIVKKIEKLLS